jgi:hypothetical protein
MALTYLFTCRLKDGTIIQQTQSDTSVQDETRSAFYDVAQRLRDVKDFSLVGANHTYFVDLTDGHFEIDGVPFTVYADELPSNQDLRLIYFRRHQQTTTTGAASAHTMQFHFGWQTTLNGKNIQSTITVR